MADQFDCYGFKTVDECGKRVASLPVNERVDRIAELKERKREVKWAEMLDEWSFWRSTFPFTIAARSVKGIPERCRRDGWLALTGLRDDVHGETMLYEALLALGPSPMAAQIELDVERTFADHRDFVGGGESRRRGDLTAVLNAYCHHNDVVGFCQGMSYVAGALLLHTDAPSDAFALLRWLVDTQMQEHYRPSMRGMIGDAELFDALLNVRLPKLAEHLREHNIHVLMYLTQWFLTMFTTLKCWPTTLVAFDCIFSEGIAGLFRLSLAIMIACADDLLAMDGLEQLLPYLQRVPVERCHPRHLSPIAARIDIDSLLATARAQRTAAVPVPPTPASHPRRQPRRHPQPTPSTPPSSSSSSSIFGGLSQFFDDVIATPIRQRLQSEASSESSTSSSRKRTQCDEHNDDEENQDIISPPKRRRRSHVVATREALSPTFTTPTYDDSETPSSVSRRRRRVTELGSMQPRRLHFD
jgi:Rab-GTPase-TBC domain